MKRHETEPFMHENTSRRPGCQAITLKRAPKCFLRHRWKFSGSKQMPVTCDVWFRCRFGVCRSSSLSMRPENKQVASPTRRDASLQIFENHSLGLPAIYFNLIPSRVEPIHSFDLIRVISRVSPKNARSISKSRRECVRMCFHSFSIHAASASLDLIFIASLDVMEKFLKVAGMRR